MVKFIVVCSLVAPIGAMCDDARAVRSGLHATTGFAAQLMTYGALKKIGVPRIPALIVSAVAVGAAAAGKEIFLDRRPSPRDFAFGSVGAIGGAATILAFDF